MSQRIGSQDARNGRARLLSGKMSHPRRRHGREVAIAIRSLCRRARVGIHGFHGRREYFSGCRAERGLPTQRGTGATLGTRPGRRADSGFGLPERSFRRDVGAIDHVVVGRGFGGTAREGCRWRRKHSSRRRPVHGSRRCFPLLFPRLILLECLLATVTIVVRIVRVFLVRAGQVGVVVQDERPSLDAFGGRSTSQKFFRMSYLLETRCADPTSSYATGEPGSECGQVDGRRLVRSAVLVIVFHRGIVERQRVG